MQGKTPLSPTTCGHSGLIQELNRTDKCMSLGLQVAKGTCENEVDCSFKDLSARFLKLLSAYGGGVPQQALHEHLGKQGSLAGTGLCRVYLLLALLLFCG